MADADAHHYSVDEVRHLLGLEMGISALDVLSWLRDPGGDRTQQMLALKNETAKTAWMARRGPLPVDSDLAAAVYDLFAAMSRLRRERQIAPAEHAIAALTLMGFSPREIAQVIDLDGPRTFHQLEARRKRVTRMLLGRPKRDREGQVVLDENDDPVRIGGLVTRITTAMNGGSR